MKSDKEKKDIQVKKKSKEERRKKRMKEKDDFRFTRKKGFTLKRLNKTQKKNVMKVNNQHMSVVAYCDHRFTAADNVVSLTRSRESKKED